jgi:hypothetical protein
VPDFVPVNGQRCGLDNLEYHLMNREHDYINTSDGNGVSPSASTSTGGASTSAPAGNCNVGHVVAQVGHGPQVIHIVGARKMPSSDEDTSDDHEYYNDYDKLTREMQPLNHRSRNETTV